MGGGEIVRYLSRHGGRGVSKTALVGSVVPGDRARTAQPAGRASRVLRGPEDEPGPIEYEGVSHGLLVTERDRVTRDLLAFLKS